MKELQSRMDTYMELTTLPNYAEFVYWDSLKDRKIILNEEVSSDLFEKVIMPILAFNEEDEGLPVEKRKPIKLLIYSGGGDVIAGLGVIDVIKQSKTPIHGYNFGMCASMAAFIYLSCHRRFALKNSTILLHDGSLQLSSSSKKAKQTMEYYDKLDNRLKKLALDNTDIPSELYEEKSADEWYIFSDEEGIQYSMVDEII